MNENSNQENIITVDPVTIKIIIDKKKGPVFNIDAFISELSTNHIELISEENIDEIKDKSINISSVSMKGAVNYVLGSTSSCFDNLKQYLTDYIEGEESIVNKEWELLKAKYNVRVEIFKLKLASREIHYLSHSYNVIFNNGNYLDHVPADKLIYSEEADIQIRKHIDIRIDLFNILNELIELYLFQIENIKFEQTKFVRDEKMGKEKLLLEIWLGLKAAGYLNFLVYDKDLAQNRKNFFECFNAIDVNYNDKHSNYISTEKNKGGRLRALADTLENHYRKKTTPPNNP